LSGAGDAGDDHALGVDLHVVNAHANSLTKPAMMAARMSLIRHLAVGDDREHQNPERYRPTARAR
jgi:hypothetical protein